MSSDPEFYVVEESTATVVAGPFYEKEDAADDARDRSPDHIVTTDRVLQMMETASRKTVRWENEDSDVDIVTDGGFVE